MSGPTGNESLFSSGVLVVRDDTVSVSESFVSAVEEYLTAFEESPSDDLVREVSTRLGDETLVDAFVELGRKDPRSVAELCALADKRETSTAAELLSVLPVLRLFRPNSTLEAGVPDGAIPVPADHLPALSRVYSPLAVYVWLDDCPPCDSLKSRLESLFEEPRGMQLFAVYGPDYQEFLAREYHVTAGPALLFFRDGDVDVRLYGDQSDSAIETELRRVQQ
ncbi:thioredoxin family protein [Haloprofundus halophilus]|uniref:thioredoxin family protein n=1 Tax=Haloprofundus halophilus TaxID=2283527 RepID=UPI000E449466|nr:thioredoxin family protein [Haloprofundus halophilus]